MKYGERECVHHSRQPFYRDPPGALSSGESFTLRVKLKKHWSNTHVLFAGELNGHAMIQDMAQVAQASGEAKAGYTDEDYHLYEVRIALPQDVVGLLRYHFILNDGKRLHYYTGKSGLGKLAKADDGQRYQLTITRPDFVTPSWPRKGVMYHIFVDRFARGEGKGGLDRADYHRSMGRRIHTHEDWYEMPLYLPHDGQAEYQPDDFFGGDLAGIRKKLPYLAELGVTGLYLSPIFESPSNHKYNTSDYMRVDPMFGTEEDFTALCREAEALGMRVMLDGVFSHTGDDSLYFNRAGHYPTEGAFQSPDSPYYPWYRFTHYPLEYESWWGFDTLPNVNELDDSYRTFMLGENGVIAHWLKQGASAWRLDVADELPDAFIEEIRRTMKTADEESMLLGEVWEDASNKRAYGEQRGYVLGRELDGVMNYPMRQAILYFLRHKISSDSALEQMASLQENYPPGFYYSCLNLLSSHDVPRALSLLSGAPDKDAGLSRAEQAAFVLTEEQRALGLKRMRLAALLQMAVPGCPCVYYGDEAGMEGLMDPLNRGTYPWGREDTELREDMAALIRLRRDHPVLQTGGCSFVAPQPDVFGALRFIQDGWDAFGESCENGVYVALVNRGEATAHVSLRLLSEEIEGKDALRFYGADGSYVNLLAKNGDETLYRCEGGILTVSLPPLSGLLLQRME